MKLQCKRKKSDPSPHVILSENGGDIPGLRQRSANPIKTTQQVGESVFELGCFDPKAYVLNH